MNVNARCGAAGRRLARVVAMDTLNAADPDTMSATTTPRLSPPTLPADPDPPLHSPPSHTLALRNIPTIVFYCDRKGGGSQAPIRDWPVKIYFTSRGKDGIE